MLTDLAGSSCQLLLPKLEGEGAATDAGVAAAAICYEIKCIAKNNAGGRRGKEEGTLEMSQPLQLSL